MYFAANASIPLIDIENQGIALRCLIVLKPSRSYQLAIVVNCSFLIIPYQFVNAFL